MKTLPIITFTVITFSLYGSIESSIKIPTQEHLKNVFVHSRNNAFDQMLYQQYLHLLAPMSENEIGIILKAQGLEMESIKLCDISSQLVYVAHIKDIVKKSSVVYIDPKNGMILESHAL